MRPYEQRVAAWDRVAEHMPKDRLADMSAVITLADLPEAGKKILKGEVKGRLIVDVANS